jgi:hypothetical protein
MRKGVSTHHETAERHCGMICSSSSTNGSKNHLNDSAPNPHNLLLLASVRIFNSYGICVDSFIINSNAPSDCWKLRKFPFLCGRNGCFDPMIVLQQLLTGGLFSAKTRHLLHCFSHSPSALQA